VNQGRRLPASVLPGFFAYPGNNHDNDTENTSIKLSCIATSSTSKVFLRVTPQPGETRRSPCFRSEPRSPQQVLDGVSVEEQERGTEGEWIRRLSPISGGRTLFLRIFAHCELCSSSSPGPFKSAGFRKLTRGCLIGTPAKGGATSKRPASLGSWGMMFGTKGGGGRVGCL